MTKKQTFFLILPYIILTLLILLIVDYFWKLSDTEKNFYLNGINFIEFNEDIKKELNKNRAFISMHQIDVINQNSDEINFTIWSNEELKTFKLLDFRVLYDGKDVKIKRNILYKLKSDNPNFFKNINTEFKNKKKLIYQYNIFGGFDNFKRCKVNFKSLFSKTKINFGDKIPVKIIIHYLLNEDEYFQELNFICECVEVQQYPPNWFMFFFPGAY